MAELYEVETKVLVKAIKRNLDRFPDDFMFQLTKEEFDNLRFQNGTSSWGGRRTRPYAFTEQGVASLSGVLTSRRAVGVYVQIMRAFVHMRELTASSAELARRLDELESNYETHDRRQQELFAEVFEAIRQLMLPPAKKRHPIGFRIDPDAE